MVTPQQNYLKFVGDKIFSVSVKMMLKCLHSVTRYRL